MKIGKTEEYYGRSLVNHSFDGMVFKHKKLCIWGNDPKHLHIVPRDCNVKKVLINKR